MRHAARGQSWAAALTVAAVAWTATAAPFTPQDDAVVLERLPARAAQARAIARQVAVARGDPLRAAEVAERYYGVARRDGDPRFIGYAQAALAPWWTEPAPPVPVLVARARLRQGLHEFDAALADLDRALDREPDHAQALLLRASLRTLQGRYAAARDDCARLAGERAPQRAGAKHDAATELHVVACTSAIDAVTGRATPAAEALARTLAGPHARAPGMQAWGESLLGEIRHRQGDAAAGQHFRRALAADPRDVYTLAVYADWLLDARRYAEAIDLLNAAAPVDALLLRLALAQKAARHPQAEAQAALLRERFAASRARGDVTHRREEARFALHVAGDVATALALAQANWQVQREPADLRILAEAAAAAGDERSVRKVRAWLAQTGLEDAAVVTLATKGAR